MPDVDTTRDLAVEANTKIDHHMLDCATFRSGLKDDFKEFREDLKKLNQRMAMVLGGLVIISHGIDWLLGLVGHK
jgi:hypothetical protein